MSSRGLERLAESLGILFDDTRVVAVVEDDPQLAEILCRALGSRGLDIHHFAHPAPALGKAVELEAGVALIDLHLPEIDGLELVRRLGRVAPETIAMVMTADIRTEILIEAMQAGVHDWLVKPFDSLDLVGHRVERALELHNERRRALQLASFLSDANRGLRRAHDEIAAARAEIERFNTALEERVGQRSRQHEAAQAQLSAVRSALALLRDDLEDLAGNVGEIIERVDDHRADPSADLLEVLVEIRRVVTRIASLEPEPDLPDPE